ncbi:MAG: PspC domain-containing protein [Bacteroidetes bacterium]|nr:PspC domain-containing protein [Bacteroidota bacterium]
MNKTLSVNIGGIVFHIEEQAYDRLSKYLVAIKGYFTASEGRDEIIQDIEGRIAEMFQERVNNGKQVILESDVDHVINLMGRPEQFASEPEGDLPGASEPTSYNNKKSYRRLYRDSDDRVIGGVCSGLSHYLGIDPLYLRLIFAVAFFVFGSGFFLYIILMLVMPKAISTSEKLEMKGEPVNISNISKTVVSELTDKQDSGIARFFDAIGQILAGGFKLLGKIIAAFFIVIGIIILIGFLLAFLALIGVGGISIPFLITDLVMNPWQQTMALLGAFFVVGIPLIMLIYKAIKVLFKIKMESRIINWTALALWIVGIVLSITVVSSVGSEFRSRESKRMDVPIVQPAGDTLFLDMMDPKGNQEDWYFSNNQSVNDPFDIAAFLDSVRIESVSLDIVKSQSPSFELVQIVNSRGTDRRSALENARKVQYSIEQENSKLKFDESFYLPKGIKYRNQKSN